MDNQVRTAHMLADLNSPAVDTGHISQHLRMPRNVGRKRGMRLGDLQVIFADQRQFLGKMLQKFVQFVEQKLYVKREKLLFVVLELNAQLN